MFRGMCLLLMVGGWEGEDECLELTFEGVGPGLRGRLLSMNKFLVSSNVGVLQVLKPLEFPS
jgi:hypothetical protein